VAQSACACSALAPCMLASFNVILEEVTDHIVTSHQAKEAEQNSASFAFIPCKIVKLLTAWLSAASRA